MEHALSPGGDGDRPGAGATTLRQSRADTLGERRSAQDRGRPVPSGAPCPTCGTASDRVSGDFDGYVEGYRVCVLECPRCMLRFSSRLDVPGGLYDAIYQHTGKLPGYDRYAGYAAAVTRHPQPLDLLASCELPYWYVRDHVRHRLPAGATVVDFGCGEGHLTYALRRAGITCFGVDISATTVERARERFGHPDWFLTTGEYTDRPPATADLIIALELIEHVAAPALVLSGALATLDPAGCVLMTTPNRDASPTHAVWDTDLPPVHLLWFGVRAMRELAAQVNCDVTFPAVPGRVIDALRPAQLRHGTWPPLLTESGDLSVAVRRARSLPWRARRRAARSLAWMSEVVDRSPFREIPDVRRNHRPATLGACFTPQARRTAAPQRSPQSEA
ncbi:MAG TPA: class I SAM-dependent methyltransferase [Rugosimonospora sp.]